MPTSHDNRLTLGHDRDAVGDAVPLGTGEEAGERFIRAVEATGGPELLNRVWEGPEMLPTMDEIRHPETWVARIGPARLATG